MIETTVRVARRTQAADSVVLLDLVANRGAPLASWAPGAHIDILLPRGGERQYSLMPAPDDATWRIGVLRETAGRGGSTWLHDDVEVGRTIRVREPQNHFAFTPAVGTSYLFLAAGIGITAISSMVASARAAGVSFELHYSGRTRSAMALLDEFPKATLHISDEGSRVDLDSLFSGLPAGIVVYCCGPAHFIDTVTSLAGEHSLHVERFEAKQLGEPVWPGDSKVELELSGETLTVTPGRSILEVVEEAGVFVLSSCRQGTCGTCETPVISGEVDHRDSILTPAEQAENRVMYPCVSRAAGPNLVLEL